MGWIKQRCHQSTAGIDEAIILIFISDINFDRQLERKFCNKLFSKYTRKVLPNVEPEGVPIATPSTFLQRFPLKVK